MKPGIESVLAVLRGDSATIFTTQEFEDAFALAASERVLPFFMSMIRGRRWELPAEMEARFAIAEREIAIETFWWTSELAGILAAFSSGGVPIILLKGPCLAERVYGGAALRLSRDIDLLVSPGEFAAARMILRNIGFSARENVGIHESWSRSETLVELHSNLTSPSDFYVDIKSMCSRSQPVIFAGETAYVLSPDDEVLYLCLHGAKHSYDALSYVLDVALALKRFAARTSFDPAQQQDHLRPMVLLGYLMAQRLNEAQTLPHSYSERKRLQRLQAVSNLLWSGITGESERSTHWRSTRRLYLELQPTRLAKIKHILSAAQSLNEEDRMFSRKLRVTGKYGIHGVRYLRLFIKLFTR